jgi:hypothetical protein
MNDKEDKPDVKWKRSLTDLSREERKVLLSIHKPEDIKSCEVMDAWEDDHIPCVGVKLNGIEIGFWWIGDMVGAFKYWDSATAKEDIIDCIGASVETADHQNVDDEECPEGLTKEELKLWASRDKDIENPRPLWCDASGRFRS